MPGSVTDPFTALGIPRRGARQVVGGSSVPPFVAPQQQLAPQHARAQSVAMPQALPQNIRYGNIQPGIAQSQRFTGAVAQRQPVSQVLPPPDFVAPTYPTLGGIRSPAPVAVPPGARLGALLAPPAPSGQGPAPAPPRTVATGLQYGPQPPPHTITGPPGTPVSTAPNGSTNMFTPGTTVNPSGQSLSYLLAKAAQRGTKLPGGYYQE